MKGLLFLLFGLLVLSTLSWGKISQVHLSLTGKQGEMLVNWVSTSPKDLTMAQVGKTSSPDSTWRSVTGNVTSYSYEGYTSGGLHAAVFENLEHSTRYYYRCGDNVANDWSPVYSFTMAPPIGSYPLNIGFIGDVGATDNSLRTFDGLVANRKRDGLDLVVHAGDLSYANNFRPGGPVWDKYGELLEPLASSTAYEPSVGNHEVQDNFIAFRKRYDTDVLERNSNGGEFFWSINFGNVHFIMLSSETDYSASSKQRTWLENDLSNVDRSVTPWVIATWHRPWYNSNYAHHLEGEKMRVSFEPLFYRYKVDIAVTGHVHAYERFGKVYNNKPDDKGTWHITAGNGGTPEGLANQWYAQPAYSSFRDGKHWGFYNLKVLNNTHAYWTFRINDDFSVRDSFMFVKQ